MLASGGRDHEAESHAPIDPRRAADCGKRRYPALRALSADLVIGAGQWRVPGHIAEPGPMTGKSRTSLFRSSVSVSPSNTSTLLS
jgi:hypothetical protein